MKMSLSREGNMAALFVSVGLVLATLLFAGQASAASGGYKKPSPTPTPIPVLSVVPTLKCVTENSAKSFTAYFGYNNPNSTTINQSIGKDNNITGGGFFFLLVDHGQPTSFSSGTYDSVFSVNFNGDDLTWELDTKSGYSKKVTAKKTSPRCEQEPVQKDPVLTLVKVVNNDDGGTAEAADFTLTASNGDAVITGATGSAEVTAQTVAVGTYTLSETGPDNYTTNGWVCTGTTTTDANSVTLVANDDVTCTITNTYVAPAPVDKDPVLTLVKVVNNDDGGDAEAADFTLTASNGDTVITGATGSAEVTTQTVAVGTYTLSETNLANYTASDWVCTGGAQAIDNTVTLGLNDIVTCTITNTYVIPQYTVTIKKFVDGIAAIAGSFLIQSTSNELANDDNELNSNNEYTVTTNPMDAGTKYTIAESIDGQLVGETCDGKVQYALVGYTTGSDEKEATSQTPSPIAPSIDTLQADEYIIVWNKTCEVAPATGGLKVTKYLCPFGTTPNRDANGVGKDVPEGCVVEEGKNFGYTYNADKSDAGAPYDDFGYPITAEAATDANGVIAWSDLPVVGRYLVFETDGASNKLANTEVLALYCAGDGDTDPNHNDNGDIALLTADQTTECVAYNEAPLPVIQQFTVTIKKYLGEAVATEGTFAMQSTWTAANLNDGGQASGSYSLETGNGYTATTDLMEAGAAYTTEELINANVGATCDGTTPYALVGYSVGVDEAAAKVAEKTTTTPAFTELEENKYVIVWNVKCEVVNYCAEVDTLKDQIKDLKKEYTKDIRQAVKDNTKWVKRGRWGGYWQFDRRGYAQDLRDLTDEYKEALHDLVNDLEEAEANCSGDYDGYKWGKQHHKHGIRFDKENGEHGKKGHHGEGKKTKPSQNEVTPV